MEYSKKASNCKLLLLDGYYTRVCLKNHSHNLHAPLCGIFCPNSVAVARYSALIRAKSPTNCDAHLAESLFQTRSGACLKMSNSKEKKNTEGRINNRNDCFKRAALHAKIARPRFAEAITCHAETTMPPAASCYFCLLYTSRCV